MNPIRAKIVHKLDEYLYTGHGDYAAGRASDVLEPSRVLDMLGGRAGYRKFLQEGLREGHREEYYQVVDQRFLGDEGFAEKLKVKAEEEPEAPRPKKPVSAAFRSVARAVELDLACIAVSSAGRIRADPAVGLQAERSGQVFGKRYCYGEFLGLTVFRPARSG